MGRILHGSILTTGKGHGGGQGQRSLVIPHHKIIILQIGNGGNLFLPVNGNDPKVGVNVKQGRFIGVFLGRFDHRPQIVPPNTGIFCGTEIIFGLLAVHVQPVEMNGFGVLENLTHGEKFGGGVRIPKNLLAVLNEISQFHGEHLAFRPPTHGKRDRGVTTIRQGGACIGNGNEVDVSAGKDFVLD